MKDPNQFLTFLLLSTAFILSIFFIFRPNTTKNFFPQNKSLESSCINNGGKWLNDFQECETQNSTWCTDMGGQYNRCASPCRHTKTDICATVCIEVCTFIKQDQFCGGIAGLPCPDGFTCQLDGTYPDAGGTCIRK